MGYLQSWVSEHKLATVGALWASAVGGSLAYTRKRYPLKGGVRLIHARLHAQALTLALLSGLAIKHYYFDAKREMDDGEIKWLLKPYQIAEIKEVPSFSKDPQSFFEGLIRDFNIMMPWK